MRPRIQILLLGLVVSGAAAQNPDAIDNTRSTLQSLSKKQTNDRNAAFAATAPAEAPAQATAPARRAPLRTAPVPAAGVAPKSARPTRKPNTIVATKPSPAPKQQEVAVEDKKSPEESKKREPREYSAAGRRDPFVSPVVSHITGDGSGCNTGKRCLAIGQITLTGIVKCENGMIAVVVNALNKAYFLRENDPVFNGYVVKITGDSVIFSETVQDQLGKPFTREITKKIITPAV